MRIVIRSDSPAGRILGAVAAMVLLVMALGAAGKAVDAFDGHLKIRLPRRGGQLSADGFMAYLYGASSAAAALSFLLFAAACIGNAVLPPRLSPRLFILLVVGAGSLVAAAVLGVVFLLATLLR